MERTWILATKTLKKINFSKNNKIIKINDIDVNKILVSKEEPYGSKYSFKYFIEYNDDNVIIPLCKNLPQMIACVRNFDGIKTISLRLMIANCLKSIIKYGKILKKLLEIKFDSEPVINT